MTTRKPRVYLNLAQLAERCGLAPTSISRYQLPPPDAIIGPVNDDGTIPPRTWRGWLPASVDEWNASRRRIGK